MIDEGTFIQWRVGTAQFVGVVRSPDGDEKLVEYVDDLGAHGTIAIEEIENFKKLKL